MYYLRMATFTLTLNEGIWPHHSTNPLASEYLAFWIPKAHYPSLKPELPLGGILTHGNPKKNAVRVA